MKDKTKTTPDAEGTPAQYLRNLAERLMAIPVIYGTDQSDCDALNVIADKIEGMKLDELK